MWTRADLRAALIAAQYLSFRICAKARSTVAWRRQAGEAARGEMKKKSERRKEEGSAAAKRSRRRRLIGISTARLKPVGFLPRACSLLSASPVLFLFPQAGLAATYLPHYVCDRSSRWRDGRRTAWRAEDGLTKRRQSLDIASLVVTVKTTVAWRGETSVRGARKTTEVPRYDACWRAISPVTTQPTFPHGRRAGQGGVVAGPPDASPTREPTTWAGGGRTDGRTGNTRTGPAPSTGLTTR